MGYRTVFTGQTGAGVSAPTTAAGGVALRKGAPGVPPQEGFDDNVDEVLLLVFSTAGSGTMSVDYIRGWLQTGNWTTPASTTKVIADTAWFPMGTGVDADKGKLNGGAAIGETGTNVIRHAERIRIGGAQRFALSTGTINGTDTAISCILVDINAVMS